MSIHNLRNYNQLGLCPASAFNAQPSGGVHDLTRSDHQALNYHYRYPSQEFACEIQFPRNGYRVIDDSFQYFIAGQQFHHFGHFMSESLSRIESFLTQPVGKTKIVWYKTRPTSNRATSNELRNFNLKYFGIEINHAESIDCETLINHGIVTEQFSELGNLKDTASWTKILIERQQIYMSGMKSDEERNSRIIISRKDFVRKIGGEDYVFQQISKSGFKIVQPEKLSYEEQLRLMAKSQCIVLSEGSFIHWLEILGKSSAVIFLFPRRPLKTRSTQRQVQLVKQKAAFSTIFNQPDFQVSLFKNDLSNSIGVYTLSRMEKNLSLLSDFLGERVLIDKSEYSHSVERDLLAYFAYYSLNRNLRGKLTPKAQFFERVKEILLNI